MTGWGREVLSIEFQRKGWNVTTRSSIYNLKQYKRYKVRGRIEEINQACDILANSIIQGIEVFIIGFLAIIGMSLVFVHKPLVQ